MVRIEWTGQRVDNAGLLYMNYLNRGEVHDDDGKRVGTVLLLHNGLYRPLIDGIRDDDVATPDEAARLVLEMFKKYRS